MARQKAQSKKVETKKNDNFMYCSNRNCPYIECLRHDRHIPFDTLIWRDDFKLDKKGECENKLV